MITWKDIKKFNTNVFTRWYYMSLVYIILDLKYLKKKRTLKMLEYNSSIHYSDNVSAFGLV